MRRKSATSPPACGMGLPSRLVPAPRAVTATRLRTASSTIAATSCVDVGHATTSGSAGGSEDSSRDAASRSASRRNALGGQAASELLDPGTGGPGANLGSYPGRLLNPHPAPG